MLKNFRKLKKGTQRIHITLLSAYILFILTAVISSLIKGNIDITGVLASLGISLAYIILVLIYAWIKDGYRQDKANKLKEK